MSIKWNSKKDKIKIKILKVIAIVDEVYVKIIIIVVVI